MLNLKASYITSSVVTDSNDNDNIYYEYDIIEEFDHAICSSFISTNRDGSRIATTYKNHIIIYEVTQDNKKQNIYKFIAKINTIDHVRLVSLLEKTLIISYVCDYDDIRNEYPLFVVNKSYNNNLLKITYQKYIIHTELRANKIITTTTNDIQVHNFKGESLYKYSTNINFDTPICINYHDYNLYHAFVNSDTSICILNLNSFFKDDTIKNAHKYKISMLAISNSGKTIASTNIHYTNIKIWTNSNNKFIFVKQVQHSIYPIIIKIKSLSIDDNDKYLALFDNDDQLKIFNIVKSEETNNTTTISQLQSQLFAVFRSENFEWHICSTNFNSTKQQNNILGNIIYCGNNVIKTISNLNTITVPLNKKLCVINWKEFISNQKFQLQQISIVMSDVTYIVHFNHTTKTINDDMIMIKNAQ
jgi:hypothetical protein